MLPRSLAVAAVLAALISLTGSVASASAKTWNHVWDYVHGYDPGSCVARNIDLHGTYRWEIFGYNAFHPLKPSKARRVRLIGRYHWIDCIQRHPASGRVQYYGHTSEFRNLKTGGKVYLSFPFTAYGDGNYHYGSTIQNVRGR
jgi:hypothetical protein